ncbi:11774_t:CDS:2, partial [Dentiscutata erythropus]
YCSLDEYQEEVENNGGDNDRDNDKDDDEDNDGDNYGDDDGDDSDDNDDDDDDGNNKKNNREHSKRKKPELCCMNGEVVLALLQAPLPEIYYLLIEKDPISKVLFVDKIRAYNQAFAFTSIATNLDLDVANKKKRAYCYRIQGDHYHQISLALPEQEEIPKFSQIYFHDSSNIEAQINRRHDIMKQSLNMEIISIIQNVLMDLNHFVNTYISAENEDLQDPLYYILIHNKHGKDMRQYNTPSANEVAAICFSDETMHIRDILIVRHDNELERISELHGVYNLLAYPLLLLCEEYSWYKEILKRDKIESDNDDYDEPDYLYWTKQKMKTHMAQLEASKITKAEAKASGTFNINFSTLLEKESQKGLEIVPNNETRMELLPDLKKTLEIIYE